MRSRVVLIALLAAARLTSGAARASDCNRNWVDDAADIASGTSQDANGNGVPDECDVSWGSFEGPDCLADREARHVALADLDGDRRLDISDAVSTISFLFLGGTKIPEPYPGCGFGTDPLGPTCEEFTACP